MTEQRTILRTCRHCTIRFLARKSHVKEGAGIFCSKRCANTARIGLPIGTGMHSAEANARRKESNRLIQEQRRAEKVSDPGWPKVTSTWEAALGPAREPSKTPGTRSPRMMRSNHAGSYTGNAAAMCVE